MTWYAIDDIIKQKVKGSYIMLFLIKMLIIGAIIGSVAGVIEGLINAIVKNDETAKTLNRYVTAITWLVYIYVCIF